jgi:dihydropteroate synthase
VTGVLAERPPVPAAGSGVRVRGLPVRSRCLVMGILNVTPDSFSDGGRFADPERAIGHGLSLVDAGADLVDVGGESTRPGARRVPVEVELRRVLPVIRGLAPAGVPVSVDTTRAVVAEAALAAGASVVNDVSGGLADPAMAGVVAAAGVPYVAMHWRAPSAVMHRFTGYHDVVAEVTVALRRRVDALVAAGIAADRIVIDPGLGFAKRPEHDWRLLDRLDELVAGGLPVLVGASRKSFLRRLYRDRTPDRAELDAATAAASALAARAGAFCVRVHDVAGSLLAVRVAQGFPTDSD